MTTPMADELVDAIRSAAADRCLKANEYIRLAMTERVAADGFALKAKRVSEAITHTLLAPGPEMDELARLLQQHTALCQCSDMQVRAALEWMSQRGFRIVRPG